MALVEVLGGRPMGLREPSSKGWLSRTRPDARPASLPRGDGDRDEVKR